jgi:branched-chain amino acid transport system ATP-binding protein
MAESNITALRAETIVKSFAGFLALDQLSLGIEGGTIHAIIGPNGAGKSTLLGVLSGFVVPTSGRIFAGTRDITGLPPADVARLGIVRSFQINSIFPQMSALDNVKVALQARSTVSRNVFASRKATAIFDDPARDALSVAGLDVDRDALAGTLSYGKKRALELAIAISQDPAVLLLDEPTAGMGSEDIGPTIELIGRVREGRTIVLVEHNLRVVEHLCDRVSVLERGTLLTQGTYAQVRADERVIEAYLGGAKH